MYRESDRNEVLALHKLALEAAGALAKSGRGDDGFDVEDQFI